MLGLRSLRWVAPTLLLVTLVLLGAGCSGSSGGSLVSPLLQASFAGSGTNHPANSVYLRDGGANGDTVTVEVVIVGPTSPDLYAFAFDLVLSDPTIAQFKNNSEFAGTTLFPVSGHLVQASQVGNRVVCGVSRTGVGGTQVSTATTVTVMGLDFRLLKAGTTSLTLAGAPNDPQGPVAKDSNLVVIGSVTFDTAPAALSGQ